MINPTLKDELDPIPDLDGKSEAWTISRPSLILKNWIDALIDGWIILFILLGSSILFQTNLYLFWKKLGSFRNVK